MAQLELGDAQGCYARWPAPVVIVSDGPYGIGGYPGDPPTPEGLARWYEPHAAAWAKHALPATSLWFWCTEVGWALTHPALVAAGWSYRGLNIWDKGIAHVAGNCNTTTLRQFPVVTEVCALYVREVRLGPEQLPMQAWLRREWARTGLPFALADEACGVAHAATRKWLAADRAWYSPSAEAFVQLVAFAQERGDPSGRPYFSLDGIAPLDAAAWGRLRAKFSCPPGVTNVWRVPALRGRERVMVDEGAAHGNQKPLTLMRLILEASSDPGDVIWEPFGGLATGLVAAELLGRRGFGAEIDPGVFALAQERLTGRPARTELGGGKGQQLRLDAALPGTR